MLLPVVVGISGGDRPRRNYSQQVLATEYGLLAKDVEELVKLLN